MKLVQYPARAQDSGVAFRLTEAALLPKCSGSGIRET